MNVRNPLTWIVLATACVVISAAAFGIETVVAAANDAHRAVCAIKASDQRQYNYVNENIDFIVKRFRISRAEVLDGQRQLQTELAALKDVTCS